MFCSPFIVHWYPKYIRVSAQSVRSQLLGNSEVEIDLFDAFIRCVRQDEESLYSSSCNFRWRHFFESDFMVWSLVLFGPCMLFELLYCWIYTVTDKLIINFQKRVMYAGSSCVWQF